jgi:deoxycitidine kinase
MLKIIIKYDNILVTNLKIFMTKNKINPLTKTKNNHFFISIEGNIGSGKSVFLKKMSDFFDMPILFEPCHMWQNINGHNLLDEFYKNTKRWAYSFQLYAFLTRIKSIEKMIVDNNSKPFLAERSIFADRYVFSNVCHNEGNITELEWNMYTEWFDWMVKKEPNQVIPSGIIYLSTDPQISMKRINKRGRKEEAAIPMNYIESLNQYHNEWLIKKKNIHEIIENIPVLIVNCNEDFENNSKIWEKMIELVGDFLEKNFNYHLSEKGVKHGNYTNCTRNN